MEHHFDELAYPYLYCYGRGGSKDPYRLKNIRIKSYYKYCL